MPDVVSADVRSRMMSGIRAKDTKPELLLRRALHQQGFRFRLHDKRLPGKPDLVFKRRSAVLFVHGCFWHGHQGCRYYKVPTTRPEFWKGKIEANRSRDEHAVAELIRAGWRVGIVWECATRADPDETVDRVRRWLLDDRDELEVRE